MSTEKLKRQEIKKHIETADLKEVKIVHAILEVDAENNWWDTMPDKVKQDVEAALIESDKGLVIPHEEIQKRYKKWIVK